MNTIYLDKNIAIFEEKKRIVDNKICSLLNTFQRTQTRWYIAYI